MKISRENYEIWFVDWLDNRLSGADLEELNFFLDHNPDLKDEFTDLVAISLSPVAGHVASKERLKRSVSTFPEDQFEILCAAASENDLGDEQMNELDEMISADPHKSGTFRIFKKLKLTAPAFIYENKRKLLRSNPAQKIMRLAWISLSAAAVVSIILMTGVLNRRNPSETIKTVAENNKIRLPSAEMTPETISDSGSAAVEKEPAVSPSTGSRRPVQSVQTDSAGETGVSEPEERLRASVPEKVTIARHPAIATETVDLSIMPFTASYIPPVETHTDDGTSNVGRFIARHFRSKILKEEAPSDAPLKVYEIAEAGIGGLNKLLGWEMALTEGTDENGRVNSVRFNSRMLKFNTPVKNNSSTE